MKMTCINCPMGCTLEVNKEGDKISVSGNACMRGDVYGRQEFTSPKRALTSLVKVKGGGVVPCKTEGLIPKDKIFAVLEELKKVTLSLPVKIGDIIINNVLDLGIDIVVTKNL